MTDTSDDELMLMYRNGDADAFDALFARYNSSVYNFALAMLGSGDRAEDVLQDTFLSVARSASSYEPRGRFSVWLLRVARNRCLSLLERERLRRQVIVGSSLDLIDPPSGGPDPAAQAIGDEADEALRSMVAGLPERQRAAIVLYAFEGMTYKEIARVLEVPLSNVKTLIYRARARLARLYERQGGEESHGV